MRQSAASKTRCSFVRKEKGLCRDCPNPARFGKVLCESCQQKASVRQVNWMAVDSWKKAQGHRLRVYGVTPEMFVDKLFEQSGRCAMCGEFFLEMPDIDHDHATGAFRGLLDHRCNVGLSYVEDLEFRDRALSYLQLRALRLNTP